MSPLSLTTVVFQAGQEAGIKGSSQCYAKNGACLVAYGICKGSRWSLAISLLARFLKENGIRHRVVRYGAYPVGHPYHFSGFAVVIARNQGF